MSKVDEIAESRREYALLWKRIDEKFPMTNDNDKYWIVSLVIYSEDFGICNYCHKSESPCYCAPCYDE